MKKQKKHIITMENYDYEMRMHMQLYSWQKRISTIKIIAHTYVYRNKKKTVRYR